MEKVQFYEEIGKVIYRKKPGVRRLALRIKSSGEIYVTIPFLVSMKQAEHFLLSKKDWVKRTRIKLKSVENQRLLLNEHTEYQTSLHTLRIIRTDEEKFTRKVTFPYIEVFIPFNENIESDSCQLFIKNAITETYRKEAHAYLPERLSLLAKKYSFTYSGLSIKRMRSRWGSCSGKNRINLNLYLMALPEHLRDYVLLHELVHTEEKSHNVTFWSKLENVCVKAKVYRKEIQNYRTGILI